jgi:exo-1,4-beta-D-glucosaminidase
VDLDVSAEITAINGEETATVRLINNSDTLAFFNRVEITKGEDGEEVSSIIYDDNYVSIFPSESIDIVARYKTTDLHGAKAHVRIAGYNVNLAEVTLS